MSLGYSTRRGGGTEIPATNPHAELDSQIVSNPIDINTKEPFVVEEILTIVQIYVAVKTVAPPSYSNL